MILLSLYIQFNLMTFFRGIVQLKIFHFVYYVSLKKSPQVNRIELINVDNINHCFLSLFYQCLQLFGQQTCQVSPCSGITQQL